MPNLPVLVCGGGTSLPASRAMAELLREKGVAESFIWTEERSTSTRQNALFGAEVLKEARHPPGCLSGGSEEHVARGGVLPRTRHYSGAGALLFHSVGKEH